MSPVFDTKKKKKAPLGGGGGDVNAAPETILEGPEVGDTLDKLDAAIEAAKQEAKPARRQRSSCCGLYYDD